MFIGHLGAGFALKKLDKKISLGVLFLLVELPDILWSILVMFGIEKVAIVKGITKANPLDLIYYPFSHGLISNILLAFLAYIIIRLIQRKIKNNDSIVKGTVVSSAVLSHFLLDYITHRPDLPIFFNEIKVGLGLWNYPELSVIVEVSIFIIGVLVYLFTMKELKTGSKIGISIFAILMIMLYLSSSMSETVPPSTNALAVTNLIFFAIIISLAFWLDMIRKKEIISTDKMDISESQ